MSGILLMLLLAALSLIGLVMAVFPRRLLGWTDRVEDRVFNRRPVNAPSGGGNSDAPPSRMTSVIILSTRVVGIFTVALGIFYIVMFVFVYPI